MFSKSCKYAIRAVLYMALHATSDHKVGVRELSEALDVPQHFLAKILQDLSRNNLIVSVKGRSGGFYLSEKNRRSNLVGIVESIDGPDLLNGCLLGLPVCSSENPCLLHAQASAYRAGLFYQLKHLAIEELAARIERENLKL